MLSKWMRARKDTWRARRCHRLLLWLLLQAVLGRPARLLQRTQCGHLGGDTDILSSPCTVLMCGFLSLESLFPSHLTRLLLVFQSLLSFNCSLLEEAFPDHRI